MRRYYGIEGSDEELLIEVKYELGGMNFFAGEVSARGYYLYARPVRRTANSVSFTLLDGFKVLLFEVARKSESARKRAEAEGEAIADAKAQQLAASKGLILTGEWTT